MIYFSVLVVALFVTLNAASNAPLGSNFPASWNEFQTGVDGGSLEKLFGRYQAAYSKKYKYVALL